MRIYVFTFYFKQFTHVGMVGLRKKAKKTVKGVVNDGEQQLTKIYTRAKKSWTVNVNRSIFFLHKPPRMFLSLRSSF